MLLEFKTTSKWEFVVWHYAANPVKLSRRRVKIYLILHERNKTNLLGFIHRSCLHAGYIYKLLWATEDDYLKKLLTFKESRFWNWVSNNGFVNNNELQINMTFTLLTKGRTQNQEDMLILLCKSRAVVNVFRSDRCMITAKWLAVSSI